MKLLISGGCKNGKSSTALRLAAQLARGGPAYYVATMLPRDAEDEARIAYHVRRRQGLGLQTIEWGRRIDRCQLPRAGATVLVDSVTALVQNELLQADGVFPAGPTQVAQQLLVFSRQAAHVIFITDYIYSDAGHYNTLTQHYCKCLAQTDRALAAVCDTVAEICGATVTLHKGTLPLLLEPPVGAAVRELVIAGAGQGALDYVQQTYGVGQEQLYFCRDDAPPDFSAHYVCGLEHYVRYCLTAGQTPRLGFDPAAVLVCSDLFCGVVPADPALRAWREATGHYLARLSSQAARVTRVFAGLPQRLK